MLHRSVSCAAALSTALLLQACSGGSEDRIRTVTSYAFASCDSVPTSEKAEMDAMRAFKGDVQEKYFSRDDDRIFTVHREDSSDASMLREFRGPFYTYIHPMKVNEEEAKQGVQWLGAVYLHASEMRTRQNGKDWTDWEPVRSRNFVDPGRTVDGLGRWKCLLGAEVAWAEVQRVNDIWKALPVVVDIYEQNDLMRLLPVPSEAEREGSAPVGRASGST
jgi:hypothetical protein